jgi:hypothetical protein
MASRSNQLQLTGSVVRFEESVRAVAIEFARTIFRKELQLRLDELRRSIVDSDWSRPAVRSKKPKLTPVAKPKVIAPPAPEERETGGKHKWTRDTIVNELATWLASGTTIDAAFVTRHGPAGLVAATRRIFGRFDAALNVASLHVSKMYPDVQSTRRMQ